MPYVASIGTHLPSWGTPRQQVPGDDEDAVEAGRAALRSGGAVERRIALRRIAMRSSVPDYGYALEPFAASEPRANAA